MKETVLDLLMYLFENHMEEEPQLPAAPLRGELHQKLVVAGFDQEAIHRAFSWLDEAREARPFTELANANTGERPRALRFYAPEEAAILDLDARGLLLELEEIGVLSAETRETVIERALALGKDEIDVEDIKWVVLLVLSTRPGEESAFTWMEDFVFADSGEYIH
ncbi:DUF494 domain-containing protein [Halothiobacillus sp. DCM-1]|uniref:DUF494 domain-containing protein n=1 Tax=Halothiobacillus sp. DCM-1 TaxID=3112558 RepID=UPI003251E087